MNFFLILNWLLISIFVLASPSFAEKSGEVTGSEMDDLKWQLKQMEELFLKQQEQMKQMEASALKQQEQMLALKNRIDAIDAQTTTVKDEGTKSPLTEKEEIKQAVDDYLSSDEAREKIGLGFPNLATAEFTPDDEKYALGLKSTDGKYSLNFGARMQFRYMFKDRDEDFDQADVQDINLRRARAYFGGNIYSKLLHYYVELDTDKFNAALRDFYVYWTPLEYVNAKIGYFKIPFNRQRIASSAKLLLQDRAIASEAFDQDRDTGFDIYGKPFDEHMEYHAAVFQGAGEKFSGLDNTNNELMYVLSARYNPFGMYDYYDETDIKYSEKLKATIGAAVAFNAKKQDVKLEDTDSIAGVIDLGVKYKGISWNNEYYVRSDNPEADGNSVESDGFFTQIGYFVIRKKLEVATRYSLLDPDKDVSNNLQKEYTVGLNYYFHGHRSEIQADVGHFVTDTEGQDVEENRIRLQYGIIF